MQIEKPLIVYLPDTRGVQVSRFGRGNLKLGDGVYTYSRLPGRPTQTALGLRHIVLNDDNSWRGSCPGATEECERICYASRVVQEIGPVATLWLRNSGQDDVPELPADAYLVRIHVSGDFDTVPYIQNWIGRLAERPDVKAWAYTRSWRVRELLPSLEHLRALPNVQLFASMDKSHADEPPRGWRRAWIDGDERAGAVHQIQAHERPWFQADWQRFELQRSADGTKTLICPEETDATRNCEECGFCFNGQKNDVLFLEH